MKYLLGDEIIGHAALRGYLSRAAANPRHHAYLLAGPAGSGKETVARAFLGDLLGQKVASWDAAAAAADVLVLRRDEEKKLIGVAELRAWQSRFYSSAWGGGMKIGVILGCHDLTLEAANAFLKTLEEPPGRAVFILLADDLGKVPATIQSRTAILRFLPVPERELAAGLARLGASKSEAIALAREAGNRPGVAMGLRGDAAAALARRNKVAAFLKFAAEPLSRRMNDAASLVEEKNASADLRSTFDLWLGVLRDALLVKTGNASLVAHAGAEEKIAALAGGRDLGRIRAALQSVVNGKKMLGANVNPRLIIENIALCL